MLPARIFCGSSAASIQQTMDQHLSPNTAALLLSWRNRPVYSEWLGVRLFIAWYQCRLNPHQWQAFAQRHSSILEYLHVADGLSPQALRQLKQQNQERNGSPSSTSANSPWSIGLPWESREWRNAQQAPGLLRMLNHTWSVADTLYQQVTELLLELMAMQSLVVLVPNLAQIDAPSREVLLRLIRTGYGQRGELMLGVLRRGEQIPASWLRRASAGLDPAQREALYQWLFSLDLNAEYMVQAADETAAALPQAGSSVAQREARQREAWAQRMLTELEFESIQSAEMELQSMWCWYQAHAYQQVFDCAERVNRSAIDQLSSELQALFHALVCLSSHQLGLRVNELYRWLGLVLEHGELALRLMAPGLLRTHLQLLLAQLSLQYPEEFAENTALYEENACAVDYCAQASAAAARQLGRIGAYQRVWATLLQARATYQQQSLARETQALRELPQQLRLAAPGPDTHEACQRDWALSLAVVSSTLAELGLTDSVPMPVSEVQTASNEGGRWEELSEHASPHQLHQQHALCYAADYWIQRYRSRLNINAAQAWAQAAKQFGQSLGNAHYANSGTLQLAACSYQLGALNGANREYVEWRSRQDKWRSQVLLGATPGIVAWPWLNMVMAAWRVGSVHTAQAVLQHRLQEASPRDPGEQALCQAAASLIAATRGENKAAKAAFQAAIRHANEAFSLHTFAQITLIMGLAYETMRAHRSASALYRNLLDHALDLANTRAADVFPVMVRWMRLQEYNRDYVSYSLRNMSSIMNEAENWWYLGDLLELMRQHEGRANFALFDTAQLVELVWCASQRLDCEAVTRQFCLRLPLEQQEALILSLAQRHQRLREELPDLVQQQNQAQLLRRHAKFLHHCQVIRGMALPAQFAP